VPESKGKNEDDEGEGEEKSGRKQKNQRRDGRAFFHFSVFENRSNCGKCDRPPSVNGQSHRVQAVACH
jgi:hypothetical protein